MVCYFLEYCYSAFKYISFLHSKNRAPMKQLRITAFIILFSFPFKGLAQNITAIAMDAMVFDSTGITHIPGGLISPIIPLGTSKYDIWGLAYVQKNYFEIVAGVARNIGDFGFGLAVGPEFTPGITRGRIATTIYYAHKKNSFYAYMEG